MTSRPSDAELLEAIASVWQQADPPPPDLAAGVLARLAAEDLEVELLTLVESEGLAAVRAESPVGEESGTWSLEYAGPDFRLHLHRTALEHGTRLDGWVVPATSMVVELQPEKSPVQQAEVDERGRFAFASVDPGPHRLQLVIDGARPLLTPPFWI